MSASVTAGAFTTGVAMPEVVSRSLCLVGSNVHGEKGVVLVMTSASIFCAWDRRLGLSKS